MEYVLKCAQFTGGECTFLATTVYCGWVQIKSSRSFFPSVRAIDDKTLENL